MTAGKGAKQVASATTLIGNVLQIAERPVRCLNAPELLPAVHAGVPEGDGMPQRAVIRLEVAA